MWMDVTVGQKAIGKGQPWRVFVVDNAQLKSSMIRDKRAAQKVGSAIRERLSGLIR
jgi:hypothetical protein